MSNQPKITYRSDTTRCSYQMMQRDKSFTIQTIDLIDNTIVDESFVYAYVFPWRNTINLFFDLVEYHINRATWREL